MSSSPVCSVRHLTAALVLVVSLSLAAGTAAATAQGAFTDVSPDAYYAEAVEWARTEGITAGCGEGAYCPNDPVSRGQMALFLQRTATLAKAKYAYIDRSVTVPATATEMVEYRAECPAGSHVVAGSVRSLSHNAFYSADGQYADEQGTSSAWVFMAQHSGTNDGVAPADTVQDATALLRIVCAS